MLPASLIQTKVRLNLKNKVALGIQSSSAAGSSAAGSPAAGTAVAGTAAAGTAVAGSADAGTGVAVSSPAVSAAPVSVASSDDADIVPVVRPMRAVATKSACTVPPPPCALGYHSDYNGDCVSDVSVPAIVSDGK
jgi:hypothetical protein